MIELATFKCSLYSYDHSLISEYGNVTIIKNDVEQYWIRTDNNNDKTVEISEKNDTESSDNDGVQVEN